MSDNTTETEKWINSIMDFWLQDNMIYYTFTIAQLYATNNHSLISTVMRHVKEEQQSYIEESNQYIDTEEEK